jgi:hypothetical protein
MSNTSNTTGSRVFVTQENSQLNYGPAEQFGEIHFLTRDEVSPVPNSLTNAALLDELTRKLHSFDFDTDYVVPSGSPVVCGLAFLILGRMAEVAGFHTARQLRVLRWSNRDRMYQPITITL